MKEGYFPVYVRNNKGLSWTEEWNPEQLSYFILMAHVQKPKFAHALKEEWVSYDGNSYRWDKQVLTREEFETISKRWPGNEPVAFDPTACDRVQFACRMGREERTGFGFDPKRDSDLCGVLLCLANGQIRYEDFTYDSGHHVFVWVVSEKDHKTLIRNSIVRRSLARTDREFVKILDRAEAIETRFMCRHGSFEPPFRLWYEL